MKPRTQLVVAAVLSFLVAAVIGALITTAIRPGPQPKHSAPFPASDNQ